MTQIYCLTEFDDKMEQQGCKMFMTLEGVAKWLTRHKTIDNKMSVTDSRLAGDYDITAENLETIMTECKKNNLVALLTFEWDFLVETITSKYTLSTIDVHE